MNQTIKYRGAEAKESEVRKDPDLQRNAVRHIKYRGVEGDVLLGHNHKLRTVTYRGATADLDV